MATTNEFLLDYPAFRAGQIKLANPPATQILTAGIGSLPKTAWDAADFNRAYGGMVSYESALDAAGYDTEAQMRMADAHIFVTMGTLDADGTLHIETPSFSGSVAAAEIYAAHGLALPDGVVVTPEDDCPAP